MSSCEASIDRDRYVSREDFMYYASYWGNEWSTLYRQMHRFFTDPIFYRSHFYSKEREQEEKDEHFLMMKERISREQQTFFQDFERRHEVRTTQVMTRLTNNSRSIGKLYADVGFVQGENISLKRDRDYIERDVSEMETKIHSLEESVTTLSTRLAALERKSKKRSKRRKFRDSKHGKETDAE